MTKTNEFNQNECIINRVNFYSVYDTVLKQYNPPIALKETNLKDYFTLLINDVQSPYFNHEIDYVLFNLGEFDINEGIVFNYTEPTKVCHLDSFIDYKRRNLQTLLQTLNYLPTGYFKMPDEMKKTIQENIDNATKKYVEDYVIPDLDVQAEKTNIQNPPTESKIESYPTYEDYQRVGD